MEHGTEASDRIRQPHNCLPAVLPYAAGPAPLLGIWTPSSPAPAMFPRRFQRALTALTQAGFRTRLSQSAVRVNGLAAAPGEQLAEDLHALVRDPEVDLVVAAAGGYTAAAILPYLDYDLIAECRKAIVGYSDISAVLWAVLTKARLVTFHGPMVISEWGEFGGPWDYTLNNFVRVIGKWDGSIRLGPPSHFTDEKLWWDGDDVRKRVVRPAKWRSLTTGTAHGWLLPGCAPTVALLFGTPYLPSVENAILCLETLEMSPQQVYGLLLQWRHSGNLHELAGLVLGRHYQPRLGDRPDLFDEAVSSALAGIDIPILVDVDFGHTEPRLTLPVGGQAELDCETLSITLTHPCTAERDQL